MSFRGRWQVLFISAPSSLTRGLAHGGCWVVEGTGGERMSCSQNHQWEGERPAEVTAGLEEAEGAEGFLYTGLCL